MGNLLKFRKHGLPEQCRSELLQKMVQQVCPFLLPIRLFQQVMDQQGFVTGGSYFRHKNLISGIYIRLIFIGIIRMKRMTHFMGDGKYIIQIGLIIQKHVRVHSIDAPGISPASFSFIFKNIQPAFRKPFLQQCHILFAHGY